MTEVDGAVADDLLGSDGDYFRAIDANDDGIAGMSRARSILRNHDAGRGEDPPNLRTAALEVLACIAFKQPISQAEIDRLFDAKCGIVVKIRDLKLVEKFAGADGCLRDN